VLRQQIHPTHRVHGIFEGNNWATNIIPDNSKMHWLVRAPTWAQQQATLKRVIPCFEAAAAATGCEVKITPVGGMFELRQNTVLGEELANVMKDHFGGGVDYEYGIASASTDFGNVSYELPSLHPGFAIPTEENGGNHTPAFTKSARTPAAHQETLRVTIGLAALGARMCGDQAFLQKVKDAFEQDKKLRD